MESQSSQGTTYQVELRKQIAGDVNKTVPKICFRLGNLMQKDDKIDEKIYKALWTDYCLSEWFIKDLMNCKNGGSYVESLNALIYNRELVVKNRPVNTLHSGNQVKKHIFTNLCRSGFSPYFAIIQPRKSKSNEIVCLIVKYLFGQQ